MDDSAGGGCPVLQAREGGLAERFAEQLRHGTTPRPCSPLRWCAATWRSSPRLSCSPSSSRTSLVKVGGIGSADESAIVSIVADRTPFLTDASSVGSAVGGAPVLPILVALIAIVCAIKRRWRIAAFAVFVLVVESATYRVTSLVVPRDRPHVQRLEDLPANASYPSGHTAASIAVYAGLVLLLTSAIPNRRLRIAAWVGGDRAAALRRVLAHVPRHAPSARRGRRGARRRRRRARPACSPAAPRRPRRARLPAAAAPSRVAAGCRRRHEGRGGRARGEAARRRAGGAAPRARGPRRRRTRSGTRCRRPSAHPTPHERALDEGADLVFAWGGDGTVRRCLGVLAGTGRVPRGDPGRDGEPLRHEPRHPRRHRGGRRDRPRRRAQARSTSAASRASASA